MAGITMKEPHVLLTVGHNGGIRAYTYGYTRIYSVSSNNVGSVSKIPYWGDVSKNISLTALYGSRIKSNNSVSTWINWGSNFTFNRLVATRLDTGKSVEFVTSSTYTEVTGVALFTESDKYKEIPLTFDPPDRVLGSRNTQTDLGYYVEEVPWEAQDAEQGAVNDREPELQPSLRHPRILRRTQQRDGLLLDFSRWNQKAEWCFRRTRRHSRNTYLQTKHRCFYLYRQLQRGLHSYPTTGYHSSRGVLQTSLNIHSIQRCSGSLLVSYRRASYA